MQQLGCESHSVTCVSCYVHVYGNKVIIIIIIQVTEKQLADFLPGGEFGSEPSTTKRAQMKHCKASRETRKSTAPIVNIFDMH